MSELIVIIRPSFMKFCKDGCRAALFNHILYWIAKKAKDQPQEKVQSGEITYYATNEELVEQMASAWKYQKVRKEVNELIEIGLLSRGKNAKFGADRTKHFHFGKEQCKKLRDLCQIHGIDLSKIGLPPEVTNLIKQFTNMSNANDQSVKCSEHNQFTDVSNANDKYVRAITKDSTKDSKSKDTERKNGESEQKPNIVEQEQSSIHSSTQSSFSEIEFTEDERLVYELAEKKHVSRLKKDEKHKEYCAKLVSEGVKTVEQIESLMQFCWQKSHLAGKDLYLKNLVNELNGWLQTQQKKPALAHKPFNNLADQYQKMVDDYYAKQSVSGKEEAVTTDEDIKDRMKVLCTGYKDTSDFEKRMQEIADIKQEFGLDNNDLYDGITNACRANTRSRNMTMHAFFEELRRIVAGR